MKRLSRMPAGLLALAAAVVWARTPGVAAERGASPVAATVADEGEPPAAKAAPRRPRAEPLPSHPQRPHREQRRPLPRDDDDEGPIGCPDRRQKLELIV